MPRTTNPSHLSSTNSPRKHGLGPVLVGLAATGMTAAVLGSGALGGFNAAIASTTNAVGSGTLTLTETNADGSVVCSSTDGGSTDTNSATCSTINTYGGSMTMSPNGTPVTTTVTIINTGTEAASTFTLTPGACTQSTNGSANGSANGSGNGSASDFCNKLMVTITSGTTQLYSGSAAGLATKGAINLASPIAAGASVPFTFTTSIAPDADNTYQGLQASQPLTWTFAA